uniref:Trimethylguanosine synthase n=1 Tax=Globodera rostochiensis TaxID=31243 RepID=A0A914GZQ6_GLORO
MRDDLQQLLNLDFGFCPERHRLFSKLKDGRWTGQFFSSRVAAQFGDSLEVPELCSPTKQQLEAGKCGVDVTPSIRVICRAAPRRARNAVRQSWSAHVSGGGHADGEQCWISGGAWRPSAVAQLRLWQMDREPDCKWRAEPLAAVRDDLQQLLNFDFGRWTGKDQFALRRTYVIAVDVDPRKLRCARQNARVYDGVRSPMHSPDVGTMGGGRPAQFHQKTVLQQPSGEVCTDCEEGTITKARLQTTSSEGGVDVTPSIRVICRATPRRAVETAPCREKCSHTAAVRDDLQQLLNFDFGRHRLFGKLKDGRWTGKDQFALRGTYVIAVDVDPRSSSVTPSIRVICRATPRRALQLWRTALGGGDTLMGAALDQRRRCAMTFSSCSTSTLASVRNATRRWWQRMWTQRTRASCSSPTSICSTTVCRWMWKFKNVFYNEYLGLSSEERQLIHSMGLSEATLIRHIHSHNQQPAECEQGHAVSLLGGYPRGAKKEEEEEVVEADVASKAQGRVPRKRQTTFTRTSFQRVELSTNPQKLGRARHLYEKGFRTVGSIAKAEPRQLIEALGGKLSCWHCRRMISSANAIIRDQIAEKAMELEELGTEGMFSFPSTTVPQNGKIMKNFPEKPVPSPCVKKPRFFDRAGLL